MIKNLLALKLIPVIAPVGCNENGGGSLNINADTAAGGTPVMKCYWTIIIKITVKFLGAVAEALKADRLLLLTDVSGVLDKEKKLIEKIKCSNLSEMIADGTISGGMIPKLETASSATQKGVKIVSIMDGRERHCILRALSGEVFGTRISQN